MSDKKVLDLILNELKEIKTDISELKTDVSELKTDVSELKTDVSELKTTVNRIDNNTADIREEMEQNFEYTNKNMTQAFEKISENMEAKEKVNTIFEILKQSNNKKTTHKKYNRDSILI